MTVAAEAKARQTERLSARGGLRDFAFLLLLAALIGCAVFMTALRRVAFIEMGYEIRQLERKETELLHLKSEMEIEKAMLSSPERIEREARSRFGLREPEPGQLRILP
ncbi:MAG: cell division protein FtsL [bacterium]|nr:cell division protein FtsL [bacterium]MDT8395289.1 cell division protein FtsL [bacterium]